MHRILMSILCLALLNACTTAEVEKRNQPSTDVVELSQLPGWASDDLSGLEQAIRLQCQQRANAPSLANRLPAFWANACSSLPTNESATLWRAWLEKNFVARLKRAPAKEAGDVGASGGVLTGYYEPLVQASRSPDPAYPFAIYKTPTDLLTVDLSDVVPSLKGQRVRGKLQGNKVVPYASREDVETKGLLKGQELFYLSDRADAFFLEIQGSGRARLPDGSIVRIGYADQNGHPYRAIGRVLINKGLLDKNSITALAIKRWIRENPDQANAILFSNPSLVFFRELTPLSTGNANPTIGPPGSLGIPLTPMRSVAIDPKAVPLGSLVWISAGPNAVALDSALAPRGSLQRLTLAQDTGGAIIGAVRADLFTGFGEAAEELASALNARLLVYQLEPR